jgi:hypothetical protein
VTAEVYEGDFRFFNPPPILRDEDGEYRCPLPIFERDLDDDSDEPGRHKAMCGESMQVVWTVVCPVPDHDSDQPVIRSEDASGWAIWSSWKLECAHGHVLVTSADAYGGEDAQPFDSRLVFGAAAHSSQPAQS